MTRVAVWVFFAFAGLFAAMAAQADLAPSYPEFGVGARLDEGEPFPKLADIKAGSPAAKAKLRNGDQVIAIDGSYSKSGRVPFYFFAKGMRGRQNTVMELVILRDEQQVFTVKLQRLVPYR